MNSVIDSFIVSPTKTQVAVVSYSTHAATEFHLNSYSTNAAVQNAVSGMTNNGGSTATAEAIDRAVNDIFTAAHGARPDAVKAIIVITDGDANDVINTRYT